ncbi:MAG: hypothetical protein SH850_14115 [Planctomycetaceae bacterium]|nr:hypothetical protein [Planctomycetaceae bacterium]
MSPRTRKSVVGCLILAALAASVRLSQSSNPGTLSAQDQVQTKAQLATPAQALLQNIEVTPEGCVNFYTTDKGQRRRSFSISPGGSLIAGGVSRAGTPFTDEPPTIDPVEYDKAGASGGRNWIHDFYFGRFGKGHGQPRLYTRGMFLWGRGDSPDIQLGRTGPDNSENYPVTQYGPPTDTTPGTSLGKIVFLNWGAGEFQGDLASITARNDTVATNTKNPGSLEFHTAGPTTFTDPKKEARAWRDGPARMVIRSNGYVGIGDEPSAAERLHVHGNIRAEGNVVAKGDVVAQGAKKFAISHPTQTGKTLVHAAIEGPEAAVYYRGEAQLTNGRAVVSLPDYFESLTREEGRTVMLTNVDGFDRLAVQRQSGSQVVDGKFIVISDNASSSQAFTWEVKAARADLATLEVEP